MGCFYASTGDYNGVRSTIQNGFFSDQTVGFRDRIFIPNSHELLGGSSHLVSGL